MRRIAAFIVVLACLLVPSVALADGDPGSDVLLAQNLFASSTAGISISQQLELGKLLDQTTSIGAPVRVAIIAHQDDLGVDTELWRNPQGYSAFLATELSLTYDGRLLVVMPNGYGFYWYGHDKQINSVAASLAKLPAPGAALVSGTESTVREIELATGVPASTVQSLGKVGGQQAAGSSTTQTAGGHQAGTSVASADATLASNAAAVPTPLLKAGSSNGALGSTLIAIAILVIALLLVVYRWRLAIPGISRLQGKPHVLMALPLVVLLGVAGVISLTHNSSDAAVTGTLATNPSLDGGTNYPKPAPNFTLTDETGKQISLKQYRGKVVVLSFIDSECQTICPLTTAAMLDAKRELGPAGKDVQLLGINANWKSNQVDDVLNYTEDHGLSGQWHFLTGSLNQLNRVWTAYNVNEYKLAEKTHSLSNNIDHEPTTYVIGPNGHFSELFTTESSYASIPQLGQLIADDASSLLPSHPLVRTDYSFGHVAGVTPTQATTVPDAAGGNLQLGPGKPHLYLFFATWDKQTTPLSGEMEELNRYAQEARAKGLPPLTAIDEGSVEPSSAALPSFLHALHTPLGYPVGIDTTGQIADGYDVQGEPWFVETNAQGRIVWFQEVYTQGWPTVASLERSAEARLRNGTANVTAKQAQKDLAGSPAPLAALHAEASKLLPGGQTALDNRINALSGYPIVVNIWGSWCAPCQKEFPLFANASAAYGRQVAFLGADFNEQGPTDGPAFLRSHYVSYPSYNTTIGSIEKLLPGGVDNTPMTLYFSPAGKLIYTHIGQYDTQGSLDQDIETYALGGASN